MLIRTGDIVILNRQVYPAGQEEPRNIPILCLVYDLTGDTFFARDLLNGEKYIKRRSPGYTFRVVARGASMVGIEETIWAG